MSQTAPAVAVTFAISLDSAGDVAVTEAGPGAVRQFRVNAGTMLAQVSSIATEQTATCPIVRVGDTLYASNAGSGTLLEVHDAPGEPPTRGHRGRRLRHGRRRRQLQRHADANRVGHHAGRGRRQSIVAGNAPHDAPPAPPRACGRVAALEPLSLATQEYSMTHLDGKTALITAVAAASAAPSPCSSRSMARAGRGRPRYRALVVPISSASARRRSRSQRPAAASAPREDQGEVDSCPCGGVEAAAVRAGGTLVQRFARIDPRARRPFRRGEIRGARTAPRGIRGPRPAPSPYGRMRMIVCPFHQ